MESIGGYLGLEIGDRTNNITEGKYLFNSGRAACLIYLQFRKVSTVWIPYYICGDFATTLRDNGIDVEFYHIDKSFEIAQSIPKSQFILYVNYFGVKDDYISNLGQEYVNLIIDNSQALFNQPIASLPTFYSPRKFIGIPDGGLLYTSSSLPTDDLNLQYSFQHAQHLLIQVDKNTEAGYSEFLSNENRIITSAPGIMSKLTQRLIESVDIILIQNIRRSNYTYLKLRLDRINQLKLPQDSLFTYPLMVENGSGLRDYLLKAKVYTPTLWADQLDLVVNSLEQDLIENIVHLPIDQRNTHEEMSRIVDLIEDFYA